MRAYIRIDPHLAERKLGQGYTPAQFACYVSLLNLAEQQPERGRFKTWAVLRAMLDSMGPKLSAHLAFLVERVDLVEQADGSWYVVGWDEWQEGDWQVAERMQRVRRHRRADAADRNGGYGADRNEGDDRDRFPPTPPYVSRSGRRLAVSRLKELSPALREKRAPSRRDPQPLEGGQFRQSRTGRRAEGTNPRALGSNPRATGSNPAAISADQAAADNYGWHDPLAGMNEAEGRAFIARCEAEEAAARRAVGLDD
jgi:hypothetical protein